MSGLGNCCPSDLPPVVAEDYTPKGSYETIRELKTYITGSPDSKRGIAIVYDVFGLAPQTLQGADRLAESLGAIVAVPDFLNGYYAQAEWFAGAGSAEERDAFMAFAAPPKHVEGALHVVRELASKYPAVQGWAGFGLCWGGKIVALTSGEDTPFKVSGQAHPGGGPCKADAENIIIPHILLAAPTDNKDGGIDEYAEIFKERGSAGHVETYENMFHGWMGARANLKDGENAREYEKGYKQIAAFFAKHF